MPDPTLEDQVIYPEMCFRLVTGNCGMASTLQGPYAPISAFVTELLRIEEDIWRARKAKRVDAYEELRRRFEALEDK